MKLDPKELLERERRDLDQAVELIDAQAVELIDAWAMAKDDDELMIVVYDAIESLPSGNLGTMITRRFAIYTNHSDYANAGGIVSSRLGK